jgi:hypothetical protein
MSFVIVSTTASSAVATNGTFTVSAPTATLAGAIKNRGGHTMVVHSMAAQFNFPTDWSVSWSGATATITYLGTTTIPAGSAIQVQFEMEGDDINFPYHNVNGNQNDKSSSLAYRGSFGNVFKVDFGAPLVASTTAIAATLASTVTTVQTLATPFVLDVPRALQVTSSSGSDTTQVVTIRGYDEYGVALSENFSVNGTGVISGKKAFKTVVSYQSTVAFVGNISIGFLNILGLPYYLPAQTGTGIGNILKESQDGATATAGTAVGGVLTKATATTGDVRGTITPNTTPDGTKVYSVFMFVADVGFLGVPQYGA